MTTEDDPLVGAIVKAWENATAPYLHRVDLHTPVDSFHSTPLELAREAVRVMRGEITP